MIDLDIEAAPSASAEEIATILNLAHRQEEIEREVEAAENELKRKKLALKELTERDLPAAMISAQLDELPLSGGWSIKMKTLLTGSISEAKKADAHAWLEEHGHGGLIKHLITISFGKGEDKWASKFLQDLAKRKRPVDASRKDAVAPQTLGAFIREQVALAKERGEDPAQVLPFDLLGVYQVSYTELVPPKKPKAVTL